jgi:hypothetical protein
MGSALRKLVSADEWESIYNEALRLEASFIKTQDVSTKRMIFNQWITLKTWGFMLIERNKYSPEEKAEKRESLNRIQNNLMKHNIGILYTIDENFLQAPLLESS